MHYWELFEEKFVATKLQSKNKEVLLEELVEVLVAGKAINKKQASKALELLRKREQVGSTGIGSGVAIPHIKLPGLKTVCTAIGIHPEGVDYRSIDGGKVKLAFLILRPEEDHEEHLKLLQWIAKLGRNPDFRSFAIAAKNEAEIVSLLKEMSSN